MAIKIEFGKSKFTAPRGMEALILSALSAVLPKDAMYTVVVYLMQKVVGTSHRHGVVEAVRVEEEGRKSVLIRAQPSDNNTCYEMKVLPPTGLAAEDLFALLKGERPEVAPKGLVDLRAELQTYDSRVTESSARQRKINERLEEMTAERAEIARRLQAIQSEEGQLRTELAKIDLEYGETDRRRRAIKEEISRLEALERNVEAAADVLEMAEIDLEDPIQLAMLKERLAKRKAGAK